ncbi:MAG: ferritin-like domain-containing protein [Alphaproteobacteria bacterium]|nr:ferritin-like domain-containing protein [Alphaproteobacteria bacterium]
MGWALQDIPWERFDPTCVRPELVSIAKAACLVEHNGGDYGAYLRSVFHDDPQFCAVAQVWSEEETKHGEALRRWSEMADPTFDFATAFRRFRERIRLPVDADRSVRGSRCSELIARCVVEVGTSSYYSALRDSAEEPVFREICRRIASDEFRHYKMFYDTLRRYREHERPVLLRRLWVAVQRLIEAEDDELAYAFYCANAVTQPYRRSTYKKAHGRLAFAHYRPRHVELGVAMMLKAIGIKPQSWYGRLIGNSLSRIIGLRDAMA